MAAPQHRPTPAVTVVGAGIAGVACARALHAAGVAVRVLDRGRAPGGRMSSPEVHGRRVDLGAGYFTVRDEEFGAEVERWRAAGLVHPWTDTFHVLDAADPGREPEAKPGPVRFGSPGGLRSLVRALAADLPDGTLGSGGAVTDLPDGPVVVAMPDPQAARLVDVPDAVDYAPVVAVALGFAARHWPFPDAAFVHGHPDVDFLADDGARRGDAAPVLVAHTTPGLAGRHLADPDGVVGPVVAAVRELTGAPAPAWTHVHRWTFAKPTASHDASHLLRERDRRPVVLAGDQWCPQGSPRVESAWRSGTDAGRALAAHLAG